MSSKHRIVKQSYEHDCGDGCCLDFGTNWFVDGELVFSGPEDDGAMLAILRHFKIDVEMTGIDEDGEEIWILD